MAWLVPLEEVPQLTAGIAMAALAILLLWTGFHGRLNRALALYLTLAAAREIIGSLDHEAMPLLNSWVFHTIPYFDVALPFAALHAARRYRERTKAVQGKGGRRRSWTGWLLLAGALLTEGAFFMAGPAGVGSYASYVSSPFILSYAALPLILAGLAADFARRARQQADRGDEKRCNAYRLAALAFSIHAAFAPAVGYRYFYKIAGLEPVYLAIMCLAIVPVTATALLLWRDGRRTPAVLGVVTLLGLAYIGSDLLWSVPSWAYAAWEGALRMALPALLAYTLLRHRLFDLDVRIRWTISRGSLAAIFVGAFFVVTNITQAFFEEAWGWAFGGLATGLLFFALTPIQRITERLANAALPGAPRAASLTDDERLRVFRDAVLDAWADGRLEANERRMLERFRVKLGVDAEAAAQVELEAVERGTD